MKTENKASHTPGPWTAHEVDFKGSCKFLIQNESGQLTIAETDPYDADEQCIANARLIAASPTMYEYIKTRASQGDEEASRIIETINI